MADKRALVIERMPANLVGQLPAEMARIVGHIIHEWGVIDYFLTECIYDLTGIDDPVGRLVIGSTGRLEDHITKIEDLLTYHRLIPDPPLTDFKRQVSKLQRERDAIAHGVWVGNEKTGEIRLRDLSGAWDVGADTPRLKRKMYPEDKIITVDTLVEILKRLREAVKFAHQFRERIYTSHGKDREQARPDRQVVGQIGSKPPDPPSPSQK